MPLPLKPFLYLCVNAPNYYTAIRRCEEIFGVPIPERSNYPPIPKGLWNWNINYASQMLRISEEAVFWSLLELPVLAEIEEKKDKEDSAKQLTESPQ